MSVDLKDYIAACMSDTGVEVPFETFMEAFCSRCLNPHCQRSSMQGLKWAHRMKRQEQALWEPEFANPSDPVFQHLAAQPFETFELASVTVPDWESFAEPQQFQKKEEPVIHRAEPETEQQEVSKVRDSVHKLATLNGKEVPTPEVPEVEVPEVEVPSAEVTEEKVQQDPVIAVTKAAPSTGYNTVLQPSELLLKPSEEVLLPSAKALQGAEKADSWSVPQEKTRLVVRASDGAIVQKDKKPFDTEEES